MSGKYDKQVLVAAVKAKAPKEADVVLRKETMALLDICLLRQCEKHFSKQWSQRLIHVQRTVRSQLAFLTSLQVP
jgi:hypothetical protein